VTGLAIVLVVAVTAAIAVSRRRRLYRGATAEITADAEGVRRILADGRREEVTWDEVTEVDVFTTRVGPHKTAGGAVVVYGDAARGCIVPLDRLAESGLLEELHRLPGFDPSSVVQALADPAPEPGAKGFLAPRPLHRTTVCWRREPVTGGS
jgi:hypothetical protein